MSSNTALLPLECPPWGDPIRMLMHDWPLVYLADAFWRWQAINQSAVWSDHFVTATEQRLERPKAAVRNGEPRCIADSR